MRIDTLKPLHGWREFAGEVGIVVLGVLLALAAGQLAEEWSWRQKAADAERAIRHDLAVDAGVLDERVLSASCRQANAAALAQVFKNARRTGRLPDIGNLRRGTTRPTLTASWAAAATDGTSTHLSSDLRDVGGLVFPLIDEFPRQMQEENEAWSVVALANHSPGPISDTLLTDLTTTLERVRFQGQLNDAGAQQILERIRSLGIEPDYTIPLDPSATRGDLLREVRQYGCKPLLLDGKPAPPVS